MLEHAPLEEVYIFFDTATYDQIERDVKVNYSPKNLIKILNQWTELLSERQGDRRPGRPLCQSYHHFQHH